MSADRTALAPSGFDLIAVRIMEQRARRLAASAAVADHDTTYEILVFRAGAELYGLDLAFVAQVTKVGPLIQVPGAKPPFAGIFTLRGGIVSAFSLSQATGQAQKPITEHTRAIVCGTDIFRFALLADEVVQATSVQTGRLTPPESTAPLAGCTRGLTTTGIIVLDGDQLAKSGGPLFTGPDGPSTINRD
ncbi:chemotaxis protein CheW [uncultured Ferrovibrio sp.]|jgi:Chemotaxis signal transduction protein|uniref:chemotaxis protein CheW n=1 Tax=uncultured Ferrovibrio sp. TaxID=1576913 RepID=UPI00260AF1BF|nr:chemotaxis protein CheW [uncultured Ferrovibrio sp.]